MPAIAFVKRTLAALSALAVVSFGVSGPSAHSQQSSRPVMIDVRVVSPWFGPDKPMDLEVTVRNVSSEAFGDLRASVSVFRRVRSRSELANAFQRRLPRSPLEASSHRMPELGPGESHTLSVSEDLASRPAFDSAPEGVYPVLVSVGLPGAEPLVQEATAIALLPDQPVTPLRSFVALNVTPPPILEPDEQEPGPALRRLHRVFDRLSAYPDDRPPLALAVSPVLLSELDQLGPSDPDLVEATRGTLRLLSADELALAAPFTNVRLPDASDVGTTVRKEVVDGRAALSSSLELESQPVMVPPGLALTASSLEDAAAAGIRAVFGDGVETDDGDGLTPARAVRTAGVIVLPVETGISRRLSRARTHLEVGRALADTAMVFFESPGRSRTAALVVDGLGERVPEAIAGLADAPWLDLRPPSDALSLSVIDRSPTFARTARPPAAYRSAVGGARRASDAFASFAMPDNPLVGRLHTALRASMGTAWWDGDWPSGQRHARAISGFVDEQRSGVRTAPPGPVTFTSRQGEVPITVFNRTGYPVRVLVEVESPKLSFPEGNRRLIDPLPVRGTTITFPATAEATGTFTLNVNVRSPDGDVLLGQSEFVVRSTAANVLALALTVGAGLFLVVWYGRRFLSVRRAAT